MLYFFLLLYISIKITSFGNNVNNIFLKGVFDLIRKVEIAGVNTAKLPVLSNKEKQELQFSTYRSTNDNVLGKSAYINRKTIDRSEFDPLLFLHKNFIFL